MSVSIEDVLALLPELFPGIQQIPIKNISPNPKNPGRRLTPKEVQVLADNIAQRGLVNEIKVHPHPVKPLAEGVQLHPDNPRLRGDGQPWKLEDFNWEILAGENRYRAYDLLKKEKIPGEVLNPPPQEANEIMWLDNDVRDRGWWAAYQAIEMEIEANPNLTMQEVADNLRMDKDKVSRALRLLPLLGPKTGDLLFGVSELENKGLLDLGEMATARLGDLGPYTPYKPGSWKKAIAQGQEPPKLWPYPPIPAETQELVHQALVEAGYRDMTEKQVKDLAAHIKAGGDPDQFEPTKKPPKTQTHKVSTRGQGQTGQESQGVGSNMEQAHPPVGPTAQGRQEPSSHGPQTGQTANFTEKPAKETETTPKEAPPKGQGNITFLAGLKEVFQGFSAAAIKDALGKIPKGSRWQATGFILEKGGKALLHAVGKLVEHLGRSIGKAIHNIAKAGANQFAPLGKSGSYKSHLSQTPFKALWHGVVYLFITLFFYSALISSIGSFIPGGGHWLAAHAIQLAHWLGSLLLGAVWNALQKPFWFFGLGAIFLFWIQKTYKADFWTMAVLAVLLVVAWHFREWILDELKITGPSLTLQEEKAQPTPIPTPAVVQGVVPPTQPKIIKHAPKAAPQVVVQQPTVQTLRPWSNDEESSEVYQDELSLIPAPCLIKEFQVTPDAEMGVDMATRRVNDLQDGERYSTFIGRDRHKVVSATPNPTGLTLNFDGGVNLGALADALSGGLVGGASNNGLEIYWEDLKCIHCNKIQTLSDNLKAIYQLAFVVPGMKKPFIVQCSSADDCERLVSALQFWVRTAHKGANAPMSGLSYLNQGVLLGDGNKVNVTWVGSPIDKSGLITGDHIWGVDQNQAKELGRDEIQTALQNLPSGNHTLYDINPGEWNKWKLSLNTHRDNPYHAKLEKVMLIVP